MSKVAIITFKYKDKEYIVHKDFIYPDNEDDIRYILEEGNYACDCNRSLMIRDEYRKYKIPRFPKLKCGNEIKLIKYEIREKE